MPRKIFIVVLLALLTTSTSQAKTAARAEQEVMQVTQDACQAFLKADAAAAREAR